MKCAIGVDLGGTKIEAALVDEEGNKLDSARVPTEADQGWKAMLKNLQSAVDRIRNEKISGIGIGMPGFIHNNKIASNPNVKGIDKTIRKFIEKNPNTIIENDANCFTLAEHKWGAGKGVKNMIGVIWGTGIGGGIIIDNKIYKGSIGGAGEFSGMILDYRIEKFKTGGPGTWERLASGKNIARRYLEAGGSPDLAKVDIIWNSSDKIAKKIKIETLKFMGIGLGNLVTQFNPEIIVIGGGVSNLKVYDKLNSEMRKYTNPLSGIACKIVQNKLGDSGGALGAAALVLG